MPALRASRLAGLEQSEIRRMTRECNRVGGINLAQGICHVAPPAAVLEGAERALRSGVQHYTPGPGLPELRQAIARKLARDNGIEADPEHEIVVTAGLTGAYFCTLHALLNPGDAIVLCEPYYAYHRNIARVQGLEVQLVRLAPPHAELSEAALRAAITARTRAIVVCTPSNPAGKSFARAELETIARVAHERDLLVITDEIYEYFVYDGHRHVSPATVGGLRPRTVSLLGASKTFAITGWRIGYAVAPAPLAQSIALAHDLCFICASRPAQLGVAAGLASLGADWYRGLAAAFERKRDALCDALAHAGLTPLRPEGAYYVLADVGARGYSSAQAAAMDLLERGGVAAVPGTAFSAGPEGERFLRVCFAMEDDVLGEACERIRAFA